MYSPMQKYKWIEREWNENNWRKQYEEKEKEEKKWVQDWLEWERQLLYYNNNKNAYNKKKERTSIENSSVNVQKLNGTAKVLTTNTLVWPYVVFFYITQKRISVFQFCIALQEQNIERERERKKTQYEKLKKKKRTSKVMKRNEEEKKLKVRLRLQTLVKESPRIALLLLIDHWHFNNSKSRISYLLIYLFFSHLFCLLCLANLNWTK